MVLNIKVTFLNLHWKKEKYYNATTNLDKYDSYKNPKYRNFIIE